MINTNISDIIEKCMEEVKLIAQAKPSDWKERITVEYGMAIYNWLQAQHAKGVIPMAYVSPEHKPMILCTVKVFTGTTVLVQLSSYLFYTIELNRITGLAELNDNLVIVTRSLI